MPKADEKISVLELGMLMMESSTTPMSGIGVDILKIPPNYKGNFASDLYNALLKTKVAEPFNLVPDINKRSPTKSTWRKIDKIVMKECVFRHQLPKPGTIEQLHDFIERLLSQLMDRSIPMFEGYVVEGLKGNRVALVTKSHHALVDGTSGMARVIGAKSANPADTKVRGVWSPIPGVTDKKRKTPAKLEKSRRPDLAELSARMIKGPLGFAEQSKELFATIAENGGLKRFVKDNLLFSAPGGTPFNQKGEIGKRVATVSLSVTKAKKIAGSFDCTVNDVYLACVSGAMNRYLTERGDELEAPLKAIIPMSVREPGDIEAGNKITSFYVTLGEQHDSLVQRLNDIKKDTANKKTIARSADKNLLLAYAALMGGASAAMSMNPKSTQGSNVMFSNVPGAKHKLYIMGAQLMSTYAFNVLPPGISLIITAFGYNKFMDISLVSHRSAVPDIERLARFMDESFDELYALGNVEAQRAC